ncbi:hypothetical protein [Phyllobacterium sp. 0TCS1.6A]|uniref:hypothetical protein n=1 Tax=Phyllobacterium sp. 0TCS1.6A TaxID=2995637 RepID=UPI002264E0C1|nr:hypothetical protein [Phyllobacterium sp. 0TCS1.6A]MCX8294709.1 hypothetical protein [Phyllobacterium sp. 0TCS1.6A]
MKRRLPVLLTPLTLALTSPLGYPLALPLGLALAVPLGFARPAMAQEPGAAPAKPAEKPAAATPAQQPDAKAQQPETTAQQPDAKSAAPAAEPNAAEQKPTQTPADYTDNRSTPDALVRSYYNAINRQEYARAYGYYEPESVPQPFPQFQAGYENTVSVEVLLGKAEGEGAAGSVYWSLPIAIKSTLKDGKTSIFNGCYRLKLANPAIQGVPFVPLSLIGGTLEKSEQPFEQSVPEGCEAP